MKKYDVFGIGNALVDCVCMVDDSFLVENNIEKGVMTLVDEEKQKLLIEKIKNIKPFIQSGGSVTNSIFALSQLGGSGYSSFLVSDDEFGNIYINDLPMESIDQSDFQNEINKIFPIGIGELLFFDSDDLKYIVLIL